MAIDNKYGRVTFERGDIGEDEPVFIFRAQDLLAPTAITEYAELCRRNGCRAEHINGVIAAAYKMQAWQAWPDNFTKLPESKEA